jgi:hypothetical protein
MPDKTFLVLLKPPNSTMHHVIAARTQRRRDHLVFVDENGRETASFLMDLVESWVEFLEASEVANLTRIASLPDGEHHKK